MNMMWACRGGPPAADGACRPGGRSSLIPVGDHVQRRGIELSAHPPPIYDTGSDSSRVLHSGQVHSSHVLGRDSSPLHLHSLAHVKHFCSCLAGTLAAACLPLSCHGMQLDTSALHAPVMLASASAAQHITQVHAGWPPTASFLLCAVGP